MCVHCVEEAQGMGYSELGQQDSMPGGIHQTKCQCDAELGFILDNSNRRVCLSRLANIGGISIRKV